MPFSKVMKMKVVEPRRSITFSKCPIGKHQGESWTKLAKVDMDKPAVLEGVETCLSGEFWEGRNINGYRADVKDDTFSDFTIDDWTELIKKFYKTEWVYGIVLLFRQGDHQFTTFRAYDHRKYNYYKGCVGKEFRVVEK